jgi:hypothetical protein
MNLTKKDCFYLEYLHQKDPMHTMLRDITKTLFDKELFENSLKKDGERFLLVQDSWESKMNDFFGNGIVFEKIQSFPAYKVATPELKFFLKSSRGKVTNSVILFKARL